MIIPLTPILARDMGAEGLKIGLLVSSYSVAQFLFAPFWGRLSDFFGRKPVILIGFFGSSLAHLFFAFSGSFREIFLSRVLAGCFGGNTAIATACIADVTSEESRSKNIGLIGMAYGAGFTIGPILGFFLILLGGKWGSGPPFGAHFAAMGAFALCLANCLSAFFLLKNSFFSHKREAGAKPFFKSVWVWMARAGAFLRRRQKPPTGAALSGSYQPPGAGEAFARPSLKSAFARPSIYMIWESFKRPKLGLVLIMSFALWLSLAHIEPVLILLTQDDFGWSGTLAYSSFVYIGILMAFSQGYLVRKWIPRWGESLANRYGLITMSLGLLAIAVSGWLADFSAGFLSPAFMALFLGVTLFSLGYSVSNTSLSGALSLLSDDRAQGRIFGINQSLSALARIIGPAMGGWLYQSLSRESPFIFAGALALAAFALSIRFKEALPSRGRAPRFKPRASEDELSQTKISGEGLARDFEAREKNKRGEPSDREGAPGAAQQRGSLSDRGGMSGAGQGSSSGREGMSGAGRGFLSDREGESSLYSINKSQLKSLADKNISFSFFQLEDFSFERDAEIGALLRKARRKSPAHLLDDLKGQNKQQPIVLICASGDLARQTAEELRAKGFINAHFVENGLKGLLDGE